MSITEKHLSKSFDQDLDEVIQTFISMGKMAAEQVTAAIHSMIDKDDEKALAVIEKDSVINNLELKVDEKIILLVARRQPAANDLRLVMALSKGVVDLERVGDEARKIAQMARKLIQSGNSSKGYSEVSHLSSQVRIMLIDALDAFINMDATKALSVLQADALVDQEYQSASRSLMTYVMEDSRHVSKVINIFWVLRALERVGDHARNIAELVIFCTSGKDVRHTDFAHIQQIVQETVNAHFDDF